MSKNLILLCIAYQRCSFVDFLIYLPHLFQHKCCFTDEVKDLHKWMGGGGWPSVWYTHEHNILNQQKPAFLAVALATIVLPHPGGPYNKTPKTVQNTFNKTFLSGSNVFYFTISYFHHLLVLKVNETFQTMIFASLAK